MRIILPMVERWDNNNHIAHTARCARICYGKESGDDKVLCNNLINNKHWSMFRHDTYYFIIPKHEAGYLFQLMYDAKYNNVKVAGIDVEYNARLDSFYIVANGNFLLDHQDDFDGMNDYEVTEQQFCSNIAFREMRRVTFKVITQISTSRELNRVSPNNIAEQSTRYVDLKNGAICKPWWMSQDKANLVNNNKTDKLDSDTLYYVRSCDYSFKNYANLIENSFRKQDARGVLPIDTATVCAYTYSIREWRDIISLRSSKRAHPNAQIISNLIRDELMSMGYEFYNTNEGE